MSLPYIKCPKCNESSSSHDYWTCPNCGYSESRKSVLLEDNKDYEDEREKLIEVREEELKKWEKEQKNLCQKIIRDCLPNRKINITFRSTVAWGHTKYRENDLMASQKAQQRYHELITQGQYLAANWLEHYGLLNHLGNPTIINISPHTLKTKYSSDTSYGPRGSGFLPTTTHESAHASYLVTHDPKFQPWIKEGHDEVWKKVAIKFHDDMKAKYGKEIEERFKKLEEIEKEK